MSIIELIRLYLSGKGNRYRHSWERHLDSFERFLLRMEQWQFAIRLAAIGCLFLCISYSGMQRQYTDTTAYGFLNILGVLAIVPLLWLVFPHYQRAASFLTPYLNAACIGFLRELFYAVLFVKNFNPQALFTRKLGVKDFHKGCAVGIYEPSSRKKSTLGILEKKKIFS